MLLEIMVGFALVVLVVGLRFVMKIAERLEHIEHHGVKCREE